MMAKVVMLTALAGEGIDIVCGDVCECSQEQATRFLAVAYARPMDQPGDDKRPVKKLVASGEERVAREATQETQAAAEAEPVAEVKPTSRKRKTRQ